MGIREDFAPYFDGNQMLAPQPCTPIAGQFASDNELLFTAIYYVLLNQNKQLTAQDKIDYANKVSQCIGSNLLNRVPLGQNDGLESVDDYYGTLTACIELGNVEIPRTLLWGCIKYKGSMDNMSPGTWQFQDVLIRQLPLLTCMINASFPSLLNPLHWLVRLACYPVYYIAAVVLAVSNYGDPIGDTNSRQLAWCIQNNLKKTSLSCWLASKVWNLRLKKDYPNGMKNVAAVYYQPNGLNQNPYSKWWVA